MKQFYKSKKITPFKNSGAITFSHIASFDDEKKHSLHLNTDHIELFVFLSGEADFIVGGEYLSLKEGDIILINPNQVHVARPKPDTIYERFYILLPLDSLSALNSDPIKRILTRSNNSSARIKLHEAEKERIRNAVCSLSILLNNNSANSQLRFLSLLSEVLSIVFDNMDKASSIKDSTVYIPEIIKNTLAFMDENIASISSVSAIAEHFHFSLPYLSSVFKKHVGVGLSVYLRTKRVALAKELLEKGHSVSFACYESGFSDSSYFIKVFKEQVGITPYKYKLLRK